MTYNPNIPNYFQLEYNKTFNQVLLENMSSEATQDYLIKELKNKYIPNYYKIDSYNLLFFQDEMIDVVYTIIFVFCSLKILKKATKKRGLIFKKEVFDENAYKPIYNKQLEELEIIKKTEIRIEKINSLKLGDN